MAEGGSSKQNIFGVQSVTANTVKFIVKEDQMKDSMAMAISGDGKIQRAQVESDNAAVFEADDGSFSGTVPQSDKEDMKKLTESVFMFTKKPLYPGTRVYRGQQRHIGGRFRELAIKVLPRNERSDKEVGLLLSVEHPNIVKVIETGQCFGTVPEIFIAMEICSKNLQEYVNENQRKPFNFNQAFSFSKQLIMAIVYIHKNKIVHRDLKPGNILISMCGDQIKVADLGLSKHVASGQAAAYVTNISAGSEGFKAPETFTNISFYAYSADIFPLGINVYFIFTNGRHPFGDKPHRWAANIEDNRDRDLSQIPQFKNPNTTKRPYLVKSIEAMLETDPTKRPTAEQLLKNEFFTESQPMPVTNQIATMAISSQSRGTYHECKAVKQARIKVLEGELKKPLNEIGYEKASELMKELQNLRGSNDLDVLLPLTECHLHLMNDNIDLSIANVAHVISTGSQSASNVEKMADDLYDAENYVQAMILYKISHDLHMKESQLAPDNEIKRIRHSVFNLFWSIKPLAQDCGTSREIARKYGLKYMNETLDDLRAVKGANSISKTLLDKSCLAELSFIYEEIN